MVFNCLNAVFIEITFFISKDRVNLLNLKKSSDRLVIIAKGFLKLPNLHMLIKQESITSRNLALGTFGELLIVFLTKINLLYLYSKVPRCCLLHLIKLNCLLKTFTKNSNLDDSGISYSDSLLDLI